MRLFHFSEDGTISDFTPRPVTTPSPRPAGRDWLNGPLVWAIDEPHQPMYLFPRDCPRILFWPLPTTTSADRDAYWTTSGRMIACIEEDWLDRLSDTTLYRYALPPDLFESLEDAGMWVSRVGATPLDVERIDDLPHALKDAGVELRVVSSLKPLKPLWSTSLHVSGIRLRNARDGGI